MLIVERVYSEYGGDRPEPDHAGGNVLLAKVLPRLSYIKTVRIDARPSAGTKY
jgi:hypothetical protein